MSATHDKLIRKINIDKKVNKRFKSKLIKKTDLNEKVSKKFNNKMIEKTAEDNEKIILKFILKFKSFIFKYVKEQSLCKLT